MSILLDAILQDEHRRRSWGECTWTARDLFTPHPLIYVPMRKHPALQSPLLTAAQIGAWWRLRARAQSLPFADGRDEGR